MTTTRRNRTYDSFIHYLWAVMPGVVIGALMVNLIGVLLWYFAIHPLGISFLAAANVAIAINLPRIYKYYKGRYKAW